MVTEHNLVATATPSPGARPFFARLVRLLRAEVHGLQPRLLIAGFFARLLPSHSLGRLRTLVYRAGGLNIAATSTILGPITVWGEGKLGGRLRIGDHCVVNSPFLVDLSANVRIGNHVAIGHGVTLVTANHGIGPANRRQGPTIPQPITIEDGAMVGAGVMILPGVTLGRGCVVSAGSLVATDIQPGKLVGGVPARVIRSLPDDG